MSGRAPINIPVGNQAFLNRHRNSQAWYSQTFIPGFVALVQHDVHMSTPPYKNPHHRIMLVSRTSYSPQKTLTFTDVLDHGAATHFVSVAYNHSYFVVLYYNIVHLEVTVFDGLSILIENWAKKIINTIKVYELKLPNAECRQVTREEWIMTETGQRRRHMTMELRFDDMTPWMVKLDQSYKQSDGINCGPIACLKVMELYGFLEKGSIERIGKSPGGYRHLVMDYYKNCCIIYNNALKAEMRTAEKLKAFWEKRGKDKTTDDARAVAMDKKNKKQEASAVKEMKRAGKAAMESGAAPGAVVTLMVDHRTHSHAQGLIAIVYGVKKTGGILVCCDHGVITHSGSKADYYVPMGRYAVVARKDEGIPLPADLQAVCHLVLSGQFKPKSCPRISYAKLHEICINATSPIKRTKGCQCKGGLCRKGCGCKKKGVTCHCGCSCLGNCCD